MAGSLNVPNDRQYVGRKLRRLRPAGDTHALDGPGGGCAQLRSPRLSGRQSRPGVFRDRLALMLGNGRQDVNGQLIGVGVVHRDELDAGVHEGCYEGEVSREAIKLGDDQPGFVLAASVDSFGLTWSTGFSRFSYFNKTAGMNVIDVTVNRNMFYDQRMLANTTHVMKDARRLIANSVPFYKFA
jgi:hypothetical protein